jgi:hypothetical protein
MRIYDSASIKDERITGFQSPASEFAEKPLSLDERYNIGNSSLVLLEIDMSWPQWGILKHDKLLVDLSRRPRAKSLTVAYVGDEVRVFRGVGYEGLDDVVCGVVVVIIRGVFL